MAWYRTTLSRNQVDGLKGKKVAEKLRGLEGPWKTPSHREAWLRASHDSLSVGEHWDAMLGTIGAGNHFAELQVVEESSSTSQAKASLQPNDVVLLVHSGSRGYGSSVLKKYTTDCQISLEATSPQGVAYLEDHHKACQWAQANRDVIALRFLSCIEPGNEQWHLGTSEANSNNAVDDMAIQQAKQALKERKVVDICHNYVERVEWPPSPPCSNAQENTQMSHEAAAAVSETVPSSVGVSPTTHVYLHRKGAAPTHSPGSHKPLDLLPLPGSRGTPTLLLQPAFSEATSWGLKNALSLAHGAGRALSRAKALSSLSHKYQGQNMLEPGGDGTWVICDEKDLVFEEAPEAYKDVEAVGQDLVDAGVATVVGWCRARVSYKVRNETR